MRKENTKKHRINLMDIIVILLILACLSSIIVRATSNKGEYDVKKCHIYFKIDDIRSSSYSFFEGHEGESVRIKGNDKIVGVLGDEFSRGVAIHTYTENMDDGTTLEKQAMYPAPENGALYTEERCSVQGYILTLGNVVNNGILFEDGSFISCGDTLDIVTEHISVSVRVTGVAEK